MSDEWPQVPAWMFDCDTCAMLYGRLRAAYTRPPHARVGLDVDFTDRCQQALAQHIATAHAKKVPNEQHDDCWKCSSYAAYEAESTTWAFLGTEHRARRLFLPPTIVADCP